MPKVISIPPTMKAVLSSGEKAEVTVTDVRVVRDQYTSIGTLKLGLGIEIEYQDGKYSQLFSLDKEVIAGSVGRILVSIGKNEFNDTVKSADFIELVGKKLTVRNLGGKLYWYPQ